MRPQLLDRFGMSVEVKTPGDLARPDRGGTAAVTILKAIAQRLLSTKWAKEEAKLRKKIIIGAREGYSSVSVPNIGASNAPQKLCMGLAPTACAAS